MLTELLNPVDPASFHEYRLPANAEVELHYHDCHKYWLADHPQVELRIPTGITKAIRLPRRHDSLCTWCETYALGEPRTGLFSVLECSVSDSVRK